MHDGNGKDEGETKPSNPKDVIGSRKIDPGLVPDTAIYGLAHALTEGAVKYGRYNWRVAGVRASIYHAAVKRHLSKWWNGQDFDSKSLVHHIDNAMACLAIVRDAALYEKLVDDRPPSADRDALADFIDALEGGVAHLKEEFKDSNPHQFTIQDTPLRGSVFPVCDHHWVNDALHAGRSICLKCPAMKFPEPELVKRGGPYSV